MYAMLVGKLPFRSSRNHSNPRAKLLQQISAGLGAHQEADAAHLHPCEYDEFFGEEGRVSKIYDCLSGILVLFT